MVEWCGALLLLLVSSSMIDRGKNGGYDNVSLCRLLLDIAYVFFWRFLDIVLSVIFLVIVFIIAFFKSLSSMSNVAYCTQRCHIQQYFLQWWSGLIRQTIHDNGRIVA